MGEKKATLLSHWDSSYGTFGLLSPWKANYDRVTLPKLRCMLGVSLFHNSPKSDMDYRIFNVHTDVNTCDCTRGCTNTVTEFALKVDSRTQIPCRTGKSNLRQRRAGPTLYQLSYTPIKSGLLFCMKITNHVLIVKINGISCTNYRRMLHLKRRIPLPPWCSVIGVRTIVICGKTSKRLR